MANDPDDPSIDWGPDALTDVDAHRAPEADTAKFRSLDYATGREAGYSEGVDRGLAATARELLGAGFTISQASAVVSRVERAALAAG